MQLNIEYAYLLDSSKELNDNNQFDSEQNLKVIKKSFSDLSLCLKNSKEIVPFLNNKFENNEKQNKIWKEDKNKLNMDNNNKNNELIK